MTATIIDFPGITKLDLPADRVLQKAIDSGVTQVVIAGYTADGDEYFASSVADGGSALWLLERCKLKLLAVPDDMEDA